jgi:hypothetical protein
MRWVVALRAKRIPDPVSESLSGIQKNPAKLDGG